MRTPVLQKGQGQNYLSWREGKSEEAKGSVGRIFYPEIVKQPGMRQRVEIFEFQKLTHLFDIKSPKVCEDEVIRFYVDVFVVHGDTFYFQVNRKEFVMDEVTLGEIIDVPTAGLKIVERTGSSHYN